MELAGQGGPGGGGGGSCEAGPVAGGCGRADGVDGVGPVCGGGRWRAVEGGGGRRWWERRVDVIGQAQDRRHSSTARPERKGAEGIEDGQERIAVAGNGAGAARLIRPLLRLSGCWLANLSDCSACGGRGAGDWL